MKLQKISWFLFRCNFSVLVCSVFYTFTHNSWNVCLWTTTSNHCTDKPTHKHKLLHFTCKWFYERNPSRNLQAEARAKQMRSTKKSVLNSPFPFDYNLRWTNEWMAIFVSVISSCARKNWVIRAHIVHSIHIIHSSILFFWHFFGQHETTGLNSVQIPTESRPVGSMFCRIVPRSFILFIHSLLAFSVVVRLITPNHISDFCCSLNFVGGLFNGSFRI